jgi:DNA-binding MarR family transcriptional regulator
VQESALSATNFARLLVLVEKVARERTCSPNEAIDLMAAAHLNEPSKTLVKLDKFVNGLRHLRLRRNKLLGANLFRDPAWDMLLELFVSEQNGKKISVSSLCLASGVPPTTALRHLQRLEAHHMIYREGDKSDDRRCWVRPTAKAMDGIERAATLLAEQAHKSTYASSSFDIDVVAADGFTLRLAA